MNIFLIKKNMGFALVEVLVACAIITGTIFAVMSAAAKGIELSNRAVQQTQASFLLEEGAESVKSIRDTSWAAISALSIGTTYYLSFNTSTNAWSLVTTAVPPIDSLFTRTVNVQAVYRDLSDDIATTGTLDIRTKKVTITVSWPGSGTTLSKSIVFYISDIFN